MQILYVKYSRKRLLQFQIKTVIFKKGFSTYVSKQMLNEYGSSHIQKIYENYKKISSTMAEIKIVKPIQNSNSEVIFEYVKGKTLDEELGDLLKEKKIDEMLKRIQYYYDQIKRMSNGDELTCSNEKFKEVFGELEILDKCISGTNIDIDMNFDNFIINKNKKLVLVDYEWVFDFAIPIEFILYRSLKLFYEKYNNLIKKEVSWNDLLDYFNISISRCSIYNSMENNFKQYVYGSHEIYNYLSNYNQPKHIIDKIEFSDNLDQKCVVFINTGEGYNEEQSFIKYFVGRHGRLEFNLAEVKNIEQMRIDPTDYNGVIKINRLELQYANGNLYAIEPNSSTAQYRLENVYYFFEDDPQIYLDVLPVGNITSIILDFEIVEVNIAEKHYMKELFFCMKDGTYGDYNQMLSTLFIDIGDGFTDKLCTTKKIHIKEDREFEVRFSVNEIKNYDRFKTIHQLRFDPDEGKFCRVKIDTVKLDGIDAKIIPANAYKSLEQFDEFMTEDPIYEIQSSSMHVNTVVIRGKIERIPYNEVMMKIDELKVKANNL